MADPFKNAIRKLMPPEEYWRHVKQYGKNSLCDRDLTRESVLGTRLAPETPAYDVQQACGTGLEAAILVANKIALGQIDAGVACGVDTTSDAPIGLNEDLRGKLASGALAIARIDDRHELIPRAAADKVRERDAAMIVLDHGADAGTDADVPTSEDDAYYAQFKVPDDLIW